MSTNAPIDEYMESCFRGERLYGNDFTGKQLEEWFVDEQEGFANLGHGELSKGYFYHCLTWKHAFSRLPKNARYRSVLGLGSGFGLEFLPLLHQIDELSIVEPSTRFWDKTVLGRDVKFYRPTIDGTLPFLPDSQDLITCFGTLHHIANVEAVLNECARVCRKGGHLFIREPIVSMGDWRKSRLGLTKRERGIPFELLTGFLRRAGFDVFNAAKCVFPLTARVGQWLRIEPYNNRVCVELDAALSNITAWNTKYHRTSALSKIGPTAVVISCRKL